MPAQPVRFSLSYGLTCLGFSALVLLAARPLRGDHVSLGLAALAVVFLAAPLLPSAWRRLAEQETRLVIALALASTLFVAGADLWRYITTPTVRVWNVFHYYLGAEYFAELGYNDLYDAALRADREGRNYWRDIDRVRNLATYEVEPRQGGEMRFDPAVSFSPDRWRRFSADVTALQSHRGRRDWEDIFRDRGYNPSPFWTAFAHPLTHLLPATQPWALKLLTSLDLLLFTLTFALLMRTFGARAGALVLLFFALSPVNGDRLIGGFLQYDWFCAIAAGLAFVKRRQALPAAACLAFASLARIFPLALVVGLLAPAGLKWLRFGRLSSWHRRFALAFLSFAAAGVLLGATTGRGFEAWKDFGDRIGLHSEQHVYGEQRVGLKHVFTRDLRGLDFDQDRDDRRTELTRQKPLYLAVSAVLLLALVVALARRNPGDALLLGMVAIFIATVASRYYWACLALLPLASGWVPTAQKRRRWLDLAQALVFMVFFAFRLANPVAYAAYNLLNLLLLALFALWLVSWLRRDFQVWRRYSRSNQLPPTGSPVAGAISTR